ncbi:hypothetical protein D3C77_471060 [compost metagenome]
MCLGRGKVRGELQTADRVAAAQHGGIDLQHQVQLLQVEKVDTACDIVVNQGIAFNHIQQHLVGKRIPRFGEMLAEFGKAGLHLTQCALYRWQIKTTRRWHWKSLVTLGGR